MAHDLSPADVILFKDHQVAAFITDLGGSTSHTAILARSMAIPAIVALHTSRELIREDNDFEDAWLWMSVAVESLDQSSLCLDNVLRVNPGNFNAASALHRIRSPEMEMEKRRGRIRIYRDLAFSALWLLVMI